MALNWKSVSADHVRQACEDVSERRKIQRESGLVIWHNDHALPAKEVLKVAYRIANHLPEDAELRFSSGDATLRLLTQLGFKAERLTSATKTRDNATQDTTD